VVAVRTEREPNRYEPLNETHRRVAEEEEKRRLAGQDQARSAPSQPEPDRPGTEPRPQRPEATPEHDPNSPEARLAAKEQEHQEQVRLGRIKPCEMIYQLRRFDNQLTVERTEGAALPPTHRRDLSGNRQEELAAEPERAEPQAPHRTEDPPEPTIARTRSDSDRPVPPTKIEREAEAAEYEIAGRGEMSDARTRRMARLWGIDRAIEGESRESEGKRPDLGRDSGDRSR